MKPHLTLLIALRIKSTLSLPPDLAPVRIPQILVATCLLLSLHWVNGHLHTYRYPTVINKVPIRHFHIYRYSTVIITWYLYDIEEKTEAHIYQGEPQPRSKDS